MEALSVRDLNPIHSLVTGLKLSVQANNECFGEIFCIFNKIFNPLLKLTKYKVFILIKFCNGVTKSCKVRTTQRLRITASEQLVSVFIISWDFINSKLTEKIERRMVSF